MNSATDNLALAPLGAGDLIDRTIRLYRRHFLTLIRAGLPPVIVSAIGAVLWTISLRALPLTESSERFVLYVCGAAVGLLFSLLGPFVLLMILGGASRNLVAHLLWQEPVRARTIYHNVRTRFWSLLLAMLLTACCALVVGLISFFGFLIVWSLTIMVLSGLIMAGSSTGASLLLIMATLGYGLLALLFFFWVLGHLAYVPQVIMIEGRKVFDAVSRSISLARGNARRLLAMFLFTSFATYSATMLLLIPLGWYGYLHGVDPFTLTQADWPVWYAIGYQVVGQVASILVLMPVWMMGLSLLYVDERVRHEGYDIELLAQQRLGEMPTLPDGRVAPLTPALVGHPPR